MSWNERLQKYQDSVSQKIRDERLERERQETNKLTNEFELIQRVARTLRVEEQLQGIRDELWQIGEIKSELPRVLSLSTSWPSYREGYSSERIDRGEYGSDYVYHESCVVKHRVSLSVWFGLMWDMALKIKISGIGISEDLSPVEIIEMKRREDLENNDIVLGEVEWDSHLGNAEAYIDRTRQKQLRQWRQSNSPVFWVGGKQIEKTDVEKFDYLLTKVCDKDGRIMGGYPLASKIERTCEHDRQEIIDMVIKGKLHRSKVPTDFGYEPPLLPVVVENPVALSCTLKKKCGPFGLW
jgi:hypothetical protein